MKISIFLFLFISLNAFEIIPVNASKKVKIISQKNLKYTIDGNKLSEISDLAYDKKSSILYMLSDKGFLFTFKAKFSNSGFKLKPLHSYRLRDKNGKILKDNQRDSEGMALDNKGELYISFERITKIYHFSKTGIRLNEVKLPKSLQNIEVSSPNKSLESLAWHKKYGFLTALEYPKKGTKRENQTIYSTRGREWKFKMEKIKRNGISEIEVMDDKHILVLERAFNWFIGKFEVNLAELNLETGRQELLLKLKINRFFNMENFEGLAKIGKNRYLMISDDNDSIFALTKLVYLEID